MQHKLSTDPAWQRGLTVVFSGADVVGEGEHKIMDYIRDARANGTSAPGTRHCMYGLDADLIMLGLVTHEPHFMLLRERQRFQKGRLAPRKKRGAEQAQRGAVDTAKVAASNADDQDFVFMEVMPLLLATGRVWPPCVAAACDRRT